MDKDYCKDADRLSVPNQFGFIGSADYWDAHKISFDLDIMQPYTILLFECRNESRVIIAKLLPNSDELSVYAENFLVRGVFDSVLQEAFDWLKKRYAKECEYDKGLSLSEG